jgi:hypothetical protein
MLRALEAPDGKWRLEDGAASYGPFNSEDEVRMAAKRFVRKRVICFDDQTGEEIICPRPSPVADQEFFNR